MKLLWGIGTALLIISIFLSVACSPIGVDKRFSPGESVIAEASKDNWQVGKIEKTCIGGMKVQFKSGKERCCLASQIARDKTPIGQDIPLGTKVLVLKEDQSYYPAVVSSVGADHRFYVSGGSGDEIPVNYYQLKLME